MSGLQIEAPGAPRNEAFFSDACQRATGRVPRELTMAQTKCDRITRAMASAGARLRAPSPEATWKFRCVHRKDSRSRATAHLRALTSA